MLNKLIGPESARGATQVKQAETDTAGDQPGGSLAKENY